MKARYRNLLILSLLVFFGCRSTPAFNFGDYSEAERLYEKKKYAQAIEKYQEYIRANPKGNMAVISRYYMAKSHENLGQGDQARALYEEIVREDSKLIWADFAKARLQEMSGETESAEGESEIAPEPQTETEPIPNPPQAQTGAAPQPQVPAEPAELQAQTEAPQPQVQAAPAA